MTHIIKYKIPHFDKYSFSNTYSPISLTCTDSQVSVHTHLISPLCPVDVLQVRPTPLPHPGHPPILSPLKKKIM